MLRCCNVCSENQRGSVERGDLLVQTWWMVMIEMESNTKGGRKGLLGRGCKGRYQTIDRFSHACCRALPKALFAGRLWQTRGVCGSPRNLRPRRHSLAQRPTEPPLPKLDALIFVANNVVHSVPTNTTVQTTHPRNNTQDRQMASRPSASARKPHTGTQL